MNQLTHMLTLLAARHPDIWRRVDRDRVGSFWPSYCFLPLPFASGLISDWHPDISAAEILDEVDTPRLAALAGWRVTQGIYRFDSDLFDELWETPLSDIPPQIFRQMPEWCVYIELSRPPFVGVFVHLNYETDSLDQLRFLFHRAGVDEIQREDIAVIALNKPTLEEGFAATTEWLRNVLGRENPPVQDSLSREAYEICANVASLALYLCTLDADYVPRKLPTGKRTKKGVRLFPPEKASVIEVGIRVGAALRRARAQYRSDGSSGQGSRIPHVRRAHFHHYWIGPKVKPQLIAKWPPPIFVNIDKGDIQTTIHPVKQ